jgi:peptide/nickel transport system permease protein
VWTALRPRAWTSHALLAASLLGVSLPTFLIGILLILVFAVLLGWLPSYGRGAVGGFGWWTSGLGSVDGLRHLILPAITLCLFQLTLIMRLVRAEMLEVLRTDYIKFARARGLTERAVNFGHALKNTLVPVITIAGLQLGGIIAFAIVTETVFQWPGMGLLFIQSVQFADVPVMAAYLCLIALIFVAINLMVDLLYFAVDPRLRVDGAQAH